MVTDLTLNFLNAEEGFLPDSDEYSLPGRLSVLAEGFARKMDLKEVNERLEDEGYETLYARSLYEAGLIYAFSHHLDYESWKELYRKYMEKYDGVADPKKQIFPGGKITLKQMEEYVRKTLPEKIWKRKCSPALWREKLWRAVQKRIFSGLWMKMWKIFPP